MIDFPIDNLDHKDILDLCKKDLLQLLKSDIDEDVDPEKTYQLLKIQKCHLYYDGKQYLAYDIKDGDIGFTSALGTAISRGENEAEDVYDYILNIVKGDGRKFVAVVGNRPPNVKAVANFPDDDESLQAARDADSVAKTLYSWWDIRRLHRFLVLHLWKSGTVFGYVPWVADGYKYGKTKEPRWEITFQEVEPAGWECQTCGMRHPEGTPACEHCDYPLGPQDYREARTADVAVIAGEDEYDNGQIELQLYTALQVTVPFYARDLKDVPYLRLQCELHLAEVLELYPELEDTLRGEMEADGEATASEHQGVSVRQADSSPTGSKPARKNQVTVSRYWIKPMMYNLIKDPKKRELLRANFPDGMKLCRIKDHIVEVRNERLEDVWSVCNAEANDYIYSDPLSVDHVGIQDIVNDLINIGVETLERAVPWMLADPMVVDFKQLKARSRQPAEVVPAMPGSGGNLRSSIQEAPTAKFSDQMMPFLTGVHESTREIAGVQKTIFGGESSGETTAREYEGRRNQAMMQLTTTWDSIRSFYGSTITNGVRQLAKHGLQLFNDIDNPQKIIDLSRLQKRSWHFEVEESIPITPGQRADRMMFLLGQANPTIQGLFGLMHPNNAQAVHDLLGMEGLYIPGADDLEAVKETIRRLLAEEPIQTPDGTIIPSIMPKWEEDSAFAVAVIKSWALTRAGRYAAESNPLGYRNVIAYGEEHERRAMMQAGGGPGGPEGPDGPPPDKGGPSPIGGPNSSSGPSGAPGGVSDENLEAPLGPSGPVNPPIKNPLGPLAG